MNNVREAYENPAGSGGRGSSGSKKAVQHTTKMTHIIDYEALHIIGDDADGFGPAICMLCVKKTLTVR